MSTTPIINLNPSAVLDAQEGHLLAKDFFQLAEKFFGKDSIAYIGMARLYNDNSFSTCFSNSDAMKLQFLHYQEPIALSRFDFSIRENQFKLMDLYNNNDIGIKNHYFWKDFHQLVQIEKSIFLARKYPEYIDMYQISLKSFNGSFNHYLSHLDMFEKFFHFLYSEGDSVLKGICSSRFIIPIKKEEVLSENTQQVLSGLNKDCKKYSFRTKENATVQLTKMEYEVLKNLFLGGSSKLIAENLGISYKTVQAHLENIKNKTNLNYKDDLICLYKENSIFLKNIGAKK